MNVPGRSSEFPEALPPMSQEMVTNKLVNEFAKFGADQGLSDSRQSNFEKAIELLQVSLNPADLAEYFTLRTSLPYFNRRQSLSENIQSAEKERTPSEMFLNYRTVAEAEKAAQYFGDSRFAGDVYTGAFSLKEIQQQTRLFVISFEGWTLDANDGRAIVPVLQGFVQLRMLKDKLDKGQPTASNRSVEVSRLPQLSLQEQKAVIAETKRLANNLINQLKADGNEKTAGAVSQSLRLLPQS